MLQDQDILVCEDEPFIAYDIVETVEDAGGRVVGPAATVREALELLKRHRVRAAILDVHLADRDVTPVAERLLAEGVPVVVHTGVGLPQSLAQRFPDVPVLIKPVAPAVIIDRLVRQIS